MLSIEFSGIQVEHSAESFSTAAATLHNLCTRFEFQYYYNTSSLQCPNQKFPVNFKSITCLAKCISFSDAVSGKGGGRQLGTRGGQGRGRGKAVVRGQGIGKRGVKGGRSQ